MYDNTEHSNTLEIFKSMTTFEDLTKLLEFDAGWFKEQLFRVPLAEKYISFTIPKKNGGLREINSPINGIKKIQEKLNRILRLIYEIDRKQSVHGFTSDRSIVTNAINHCNKRFVLNIDIKDFFYTITQKRIRGVLMSPPYNLPSKVATTISHICCYKGRLPQGAPTSPIVSNMVCAKLDSELRLIAKKNGCFYTRYADDITFSTTASKFPTSIAEIKSIKISDITLSDNLTSIFESNGFQINFNKVRIQRENQRQEVTGLTVNKGLNVPRKYIRQIRSMLHNWETKGYVKAHIENLLIRHQQKKKPARFYSVVRGKIEFVGKVRGKDDSIYQRLLVCYQSLMERESIRLRSLEFNNEDYIHWCETVDEYLDNMTVNYINNIRQYIENIKECIQQGFDELEKLRRKEDPNYNLPGIPIAYAFMYLPRKIMAVTAVLSHYFRSETAPIPGQILDVGSGSDAVSIALGLFRRKIPFKITAIEPSNCMREFSVFKPTLPNLEISNVYGLLGDWFTNLQDNHYDLIFMSLILQNSFLKKPNDWWFDWTKDLYQASTNNARLILIEPVVKKDLIEKMKLAMESSGWILGEEILLSDLFPHVSNKKYILNKLTKLKEKLIDNYWKYPVESWNTYYKYDEIIHIYSKR